jgi:two-component sensor histidine kinase
MVEMVDSGATVPPLPLARQPRNLISLKQVERVMSRSVAGFGIVFGAQAVPSVVGQIDEAYPVWLWIVVPALYATLVVVAILSGVQSWVRQSQGVFAFIYLGALISWPFAVIPGGQVMAGAHWLWYLMTVATAMAAISFNALIGTIYLVFIPTIYFIARITPNGGGAVWHAALIEAVYAFILGAAVLIIAIMLRVAASNVDSAQATALDRYGRAVRAHATEVERVQVDSIVHDSVLTTFLSAARAFTPEAQALAATMAGNAIGHLKEAALVLPDDPSMVRVSTLVERIVASARELTGPFEVHLKSLGTRSIPAQAAEAVHSAAVQSMVNSIQHAGGYGVERWISARAIAAGGVEVVVGDTGAGFDLSGGPSERIGVRVSIIERMTNAGGRVVIKTAPSEGTTVTLRWPAPASEKAAARSTGDASGGAVAGAESRKAVSR